MLGRLFIRTCLFSWAQRVGVETHSHIWRADCVLLWQPLSCFGAFNSLGFLFSTEVHLFIFVPISTMQLFQKNTAPGS